MFSENSGYAWLWLCASSSLHLCRIDVYPCWKLSRGRYIHTEKVKFRKNVKPVLLHYNTKITPVPPKEKMCFLLLSFKVGQISLHPYLSPSLACQCCPVAVISSWNVCWTPHLNSVCVAETLNFEFHFIHRYAAHTQAIQHVYVYTHKYGKEIRICSEQLLDEWKQ